MASVWQDVLERDSCHEEEPLFEQVHGSPEVTDQGTVPL